MLETVPGCNKTSFQRRINLMLKFGQVSLDLLEMWDHNQAVHVREPPTPPSLKPFSAVGSFTLLFPLFNLIC